MNKAMRREHRLTVILVLIVITFLLCHFLSCLLNTYELYTAINGQWL